MATLATYRHPEDKTPYDDNWLRDNWHTRPEIRYAHIADETDYEVYDGDETVEFDEHVELAKIQQNNILQMKTKWRFQEFMDEVVAIRRAWRQKGGYSESYQGSPEIKVVIRQPDGTETKHDFSIDRGYSELQFLVEL